MILHNTLFLLNSHSARSLPWCLVNLVHLNQAFKGPRATWGGKKRRVDGQAEHLAAMEMN